MKIVIIGGTGHIGYALNGISASDNRLKLCAFASAASDDMSAATAEMLKSKFGAESFDDWRQMLSKVKPDVAVIATRFDLNGVISLECLKLGINCFTEKTIANSMELLSRIEDAAHKNNAQIIGMHGMRYTPEFFAAYEAVQSGVIGDIVMLYGRKSYRFGNDRPDFYRKRENYGGTIPWVAVHALDWFHWLAGLPDEVYAAHTVKGNKGYGDCESATVVSVRFGNGIVGTVSADFLRPEKAESHGDDQLRIAGTNGIVEVAHGKAILTTNSEPPRELDLKPEGDFFGDFCSSLQGEGGCLLTMNDTFQVSRLALAALQSADSHKIVSV